MSSTVHFIAGAFAILLIVLLYGITSPSDVSQIEINLGCNIVETARTSGVPKFGTRNVAGLVSYSVDNLPDDLTVMFARPGFEASFAPIFAVTLYADVGL